MDPALNLSRSINQRNLISIVTTNNIGNESAMSQKRRELLNSIQWSREQLKLIQNETNTEICVKYQGVMNSMKARVVGFSEEELTRKFPEYMKQLEFLRKKIEAEKKKLKLKELNNVSIDLTDEDDTVLNIPKNVASTSSANTRNQTLPSNSRKSSSIATVQNLNSSRPSTGDGSKRSPMNESSVHSSQSNMSHYKPIVNLDDLLEAVNSSAAQKKSSTVVDVHSPVVENALGVSPSVVTKSPVEKNVVGASLPSVNFDAAKIKEALSMATKKVDPISQYEERVRKKIGVQPAVPSGKLSDVLELMMNAGNESPVVKVEPPRPVSPPPLSVLPLHPVLQPQPVSPPRPVPAPCLVPAPGPLLAPGPVPAPRPVPAPEPVPVPHSVPRSRLLPTPCPVPIPRPVSAAFIPPPVHAQVRVPSGYSTPPPTPNINDGYTTPPPTPNINDEPAEKPIRPPLTVKSDVPNRPSAKPPELKGTGVRNKLAQEITQVHRGGDSSKIRGSLKMLKSNVKSTGPTVDGQTNVNARSQQIPTIKPADKLPIPSLLTMQVNPVLDKVASKSQDNACKQPRSLPTERPVAANHNSSNSIPQKYVPKFSHSQNNARKFETSNRYNPGVKSNAFSIDRRPNTKSSAENQRKDVNGIIDYTKRVKETTEFQSPLSCMYPETNSSSSRPSYGYKKFAPSFKIPKVHNSFNSNASSDNSFNPKFPPKVPVSETRNTGVEKNRVPAPRTISSSPQNLTVSAADSTANDSSLRGTKKKSNKRKRIMTRMTDDVENDEPNEDGGNLKEAESSTSEETENLFEDNLIQDNAIENVIIPDTITSENTKVKKKPLTDSGGSSNEAESPALKKLKSKVPDNRNKTIKEAVTKSVRPTLPKKVASIPRQRESSDVSDETPVLEKSSEKTPVPAKSSDKRPVPAKSSEKTPALAKSSEKTPLPTKSSEKTPAPAKSSEKTPSPPKSSAKTPVPAKSSEKTSVLAKSSDKTSDDVTQGPVTIKRKLRRSDNIIAKRKRVVSESEEDEEKEEEEEENLLSDAITKIDDSLSDTSSLSPVIIEYDTDLDEPEPSSIMADEKSSAESMKKDESTCSKAKSTLQELKSAESKQDPTILKQKLVKLGQRFNFAEQTPILKLSPIIPEQKCVSPKPLCPVLKQKPSPAESEEEADGDPTDDEKLERLKSIPWLKSRIEDNKLKGIRLYPYLLETLKPEEFKVVQEVLKGTARSLKTESTNIILNAESKSEKPSIVSSTTPSSPVLNLDESVATTSSSPASKAQESDIDLTGSPVSAASTSSLNKSKISSKSRKVVPISRKTSSKSQKTSSKLQKTSSKLQKTSSKLQKTSPKLQKISPKSLKTSPKKLPMAKRRKLNELDRLHADIEKMRRTKNNIFTAVGPRACRKHIPMYNDDDQKVESTILPRNLVPKVPGEDWSSSSDENVFRPTNSKTPVKRKKNSHMFSSSSDDTEPNSSEDEGSQVMSFERARRRSSSKIRNRSRSSTCKNTRQSRSRSISHKYAERDRSSSSCSEVEIKKQTKKCSSDVEKSESKLTGTSHKKDRSVEGVKLDSKNVPDAVIETSRLPKLKICLPRLEDTNYKEFLRKQQILDDNEVASASNEDALDSSFSECEPAVSYKIIDESQTNFADTGKKPPITLKFKKSTTPQKKASKLFPKKGKRPVLNANDRIKLLPDRNWFKDGGSFLQHVPIIIRLRQNKSRGHELLYECTPDSCSIEEYNSTDAKMFAQHLSFAHGQVEWNGQCELCKKVHPKSDLVDAFAHLMEEHLIFVNKSPPFTPISPSKSAAALVSSRKKKVTLINRTKNATSAVFEHDSVSSSTKIIFAKDPPKNTPSAIYVNNSVSKSPDTLEVEEPSKNIPTKVPRDDSISTPNEEVPVKEPVKTSPTTFSKDNYSVSFPKEIATIKPIQNTLTITRVETVQAKPPLKKAVARKRITGPISLKTIRVEQSLQRSPIPEQSNNVLVIESVTSVPSIPASKPSSEFPVIERVINVPAIPAPKPSNDITVIESIETVPSITVLKPLDGTPVMKRATTMPLVTVPTNIPASTQVEIVLEKESSSSTESSTSIKILADKPTILSVSPHPVQVEHFSIESKISDATLAEAASAPEHVCSPSVTPEANEITELLPASAEENKKTSSNDILKSAVHPTETNSDSSKPRIRVRRLSGDKLSGSSPISKSENIGSRRASTNDIVSGLEQTQSTKQFNRTIQSVKTMQQQNENESSSSTISQANTTKSSPPDATTQSIPSGGAASSSASSVANQSDSSGAVAVSASSITTQSIPSGVAAVSSASSAVVQIVPSGAAAASSASSAVLQSVPSGAAVISSTPSAMTQTVTSGATATDFASSTMTQNVTLGAAATSSASSATTFPRKQRSVHELREEQMVNFFKCGSCCLNARTAPQLLDHFERVHKIKNKRCKKVDLTCLNCIYCRLSHKTPENLISHMNYAHRFSSYQCPHCSYRACRPVYVAWHLQAEHPTIDEKKILVSNLEDNYSALKQNNVGEKALFEVVPGFTCAFGCPEFFTRSTYEFTEHMRKNHDQLSQLKCIKSECNAVCLSLNNLLKHLSVAHSFNEYQCTYCEKGYSSLEIVKSHLFKEHHSSYPKVLRRACTVEDLSEGQIKTLDLDEPVGHFLKYLKVVGSTVTTTEEYSRNGNDDDPSSSGAPNSSLTGSSNNAIGSSSSAAPGGGDNFSNLTTTATFTKTQNTATGGIVSANPAVRTRAPITVMGLSGKDLYRCGMLGCAVAVDDYYAFKEHTFTCDNARNSPSTTCVHCRRSFVKNDKFFDHINMHGVPRYWCSLCDFKYTSVPKVSEHMKTHKVWKTKTVPADSLKTNRFSDIFFIVPDLDKKSRGPAKAAPKSASTVTPRPKAVAAPQATPVPQVTVVYSRKDVENQLPSMLFKEPVKCGLCNYSSKVRTNILYHMDSHVTGIASTNKDIVNPVPQTEKTELMFNKMTNHAAYSAKNGEKKNIVETKIEVSANVASKL